jgi:HK97 gp10 family phage protein
MLHGYGKDAQLEVRVVIADIAQKIEADARARVPVDTGTLAKFISHKLKSDRLAAAIGILGKRAMRKAFYAKFVEFGTRGYVAGDTRRTSGSSTTKKIRKAVAPRPAQPFLFPATRKFAREFDRRMAEALQKAVAWAKRKTR